MFEWTKSCSYDDKQKRRFHSIARSRLKKLAAELGLPAGTHEIRSSRAGSAVSGEISLQHDRFYLQVSQFGLASGHGILIRTCKGRKDHTGGANHFVGLRLLDDIPALAAAVRAITGVGPIGSNSKDEQASRHQAETVSAAGARSRRHHSATANLEGRP
ncbi:hypothetical protein [Mesorhizobium sp. GR13]|uniref:hypothetical protein n=1 Tax=Mesorhizobium sp. GR13 TaxID=2562308 RepID=UPI001FEFA965|nr:hypothetical protein [Mesorhizobium sp. GR13]